MRKRKLGHSGIEVSQICLGTMTWGEQNTEAQAHEQLDYAVEAGVNFIDAAEMYPVPPKAETYTRTETMVGNWLKHQPRDKIILSGKVAGPRRGLGWIRGGPPSLDRANIRAAIEGSLQRMQTDYIDLYQLHWPDRRYAGFGFHHYADYDADYESFHAILETLDRHVKAGRIRHIGVSNESPYGVMKFLAESETHGLPRIASIQNAYSLVSRAFDYGLAEVSLREDVGLLAYSSLAQGYLTGKYRNGALPEGARKTLYQRLGRYEGPGGQEMIDKYVDLAAELGLKPEQLALKFVDQRPFVTSTIIGASTMDQLVSDIDAFDLEWTPEIDKAIMALHLSHPNPCP